MLLRPLAGEQEYGVHAIDTFLHIDYRPKRRRSAFASAICWLVNLLRVQRGLQFLQTIAYILVIAALVQFIEMFLQKAMPSLYTALGGGWNMSHKAIMDGPSGR